MARTTCRSQTKDRRQLLIYTYVLSDAQFLTQQTGTFKTFMSLFSLISASFSFIWKLETIFVLSAVKEVGQYVSTEHRTQSP